MAAATGSLAFGLFVLGSTSCGSDGPLAPSSEHPDASDAAGQPDSKAPPAIARRGWELTASNTGLAPLGLDCAQLSPYTGPVKPAAGTIITEKRIRTALDLSAGNIVVERSCIRPESLTPGTSLVTTTDFDACVGDDCPVAPATVTLRDSDIDGSALDNANVAKSCAFLGIGTLQRNHIHDVGSGICFFNTGSELDGLAEGNYVHALRAFGDPATDGSHNESFTLRDFPTRSHPDRRATIRNNRLDSSSGNDTGALFIQTYGGDIDRVTIEGNLLEGKGYQLILEAGHDHIYGRAMSAIDNRFSGTGYGPGYVERRGLSYGWTTFRDNALHDPSKPNHAGNPISNF